MRLYLDTEFNGHGGDLISMALIGCEPRPACWYEAQWISAPIEEWVKENVMPKLERQLTPPPLFKRFFHEWIRQFDNPEIVCDWHADAAHFCRMLEGLDYGSSLDFACRLTIIKTPPGQPISSKPHNALADAVALQAWHSMYVKAA